MSVSGYDRNAGYAYGEQREKACRRSGQNDESGFSVVPHVSGILCGRCGVLLRDK